MHYFRAAKLDVERYFGITGFQDAYGKGLISRPLVGAQLLCGELQQKYEQCIRKHGADSEECQEATMMLVFCTTAVYANDHYLKLQKCLQDLEAGKVADCEGPISTAMQASEARYREESERAKTMSNDRKLKDSLQRCGFGTENPGEKEQSATFSCIAPLLCPNQLSVFMDCVDKNGGDYAAPACEKAGLEFGGCFGAAVADASAAFASGIHN